ERALSGLPVRTQDDLGLGKLQAGDDSDRVLRDTTSDRLASLRPFWKLQGHGPWGEPHQPTQEPADRSWLGTDLVFAPDEPAWTLENDGIKPRASVDVNNARAEFVPMLQEEIARKVTDSRYVESSIFTTSQSIRCTVLITRIIDIFSSPAIHHNRSARESVTVILEFTWAEFFQAWQVRLLHYLAIDLVLATDNLAKLQFATVAATRRHGDSRSDRWPEIDSHRESLSEISHSFRAAYFVEPGLKRHVPRGKRGLGCWKEQSPNAVRPITLGYRCYRRLTWWSRCNGARHSRRQAGRGGRDPV